MTDRGLLPADQPTDGDAFLDDGSCWFNVACSRIAAAMLVGIFAIWIVTEIVR